MAEFNDVAKPQRDTADRQPTTPKVHDVPLSRPLTDAQRQSIAAAQRAFDSALDVMRDTRSGDGIQQSVIDKYKQINPPQRGPVR